MENKQCLLSSKKISRKLATEHLRRWKTQFDQPFWRLSVQHIVHVLVVVPGVFLPSLSCSLRCWNRSQEATFKIFPIDSAKQYVEFFAFVKNVVIDRTLLPWHTRLQKSRFTACRNNVDSKLTNAAWTCCLRQCKPSKNHFVFKF